MWFADYPQKPQHCFWGKNKSIELIKYNFSMLWATQTNPHSPPLCCSGGRSLSRGYFSTSASKDESIFMASSNSQHFFSKISSETMHKIMFCLLLYVWVERAIRRAKVLLLQCILVPWGGCGWRDWHLSQFEKVYFMFECQTLVKNNNSPRMLKISPSLFPINPLH